MAAVPPKRDRETPEFGLNRKRPTINDVARIARVSKKTVSRVINRSPSVSDETRARVEKAIAEFGFAPDPQARGLAFRRSFLIGLAFDNPNPQYVVNMQSGILDGLRGSGFELVVHPCNRSDPSFMDDLRGFIERQRLYGVVLTPSVSEDVRIAELLSELGCGYVRVASVLLDAPEHMIVTHDRDGGAAAAVHLADLGHKQFALVMGAANFRSAQERRAGFEDGLAQRGIKLRAEIHRAGRLPLSIWRRAGVKLLAMKPAADGHLRQQRRNGGGVSTRPRLARAGRSRAIFSMVGFDDTPVSRPRRGRR